MKDERKGFHEYYVIETPPIFFFFFKVEIYFLHIRSFPSFRSPPEVFHTGCIRRRFIMVPEGATSAVFAIKSSNTEHTQKMSLHAIQLLPQRSVLTYDYFKVGVIHFRRVNLRLF